MKHAKARALILRRGIYIYLCWSPPRPPPSTPALGFAALGSSCIDMKARRRATAGQTRGGGEKECAREHKHKPVGSLAGQASASS